MNFHKFFKSQTHLLFFASPASSSFPLSLCLSLPFLSYFPLTSISVRILTSFPWAQTWRPRSCLVSALEHPSSEAGAALFPNLKKTKNAFVTRVRSASGEDETFIVLVFFSSSENGNWESKLGGMRRHKRRKERDSEWERERERGEKKTRTDIELEPQATRSCHMTTELWLVI